VSCAASCASWQAALAARLLLPHPGSLLRLPQQDVRQQRLQHLLVLVLLLLCQ
jgi:hypothetical protein